MSCEITELWKKQSNSAYLLMSVNTTKHWLLLGFQEHAHERVFVSFPSMLYPVLSNSALLEKKCVVVYNVKNIPWLLHLYQLHD